MLNIEPLITCFSIKFIIQYGNRCINSNDIDLLIISDDFATIYLPKRKKLVISILNSRKKIDPICLTNKELKLYLSTQNPYYLKIMKEGVILYGNHLR